MHRVALLPSLFEGIANKPELFQPDRLHPTAQAQSLILENISKALAPLLAAPSARR